MFGATALKIKIEITRKYQIDQNSDRFLKLMKYLYSGHENIKHSRGAFAAFGVEVIEE